MVDSITLEVKIWNPLLMVITTLQIWKSTWLKVYVTAIQITFYGELIVSLLRIDLIKFLWAHFFKSLFTWKYILTDIVPCSRIPSSFFVNFDVVLSFVFSPCFFSDYLYDITTINLNITKQTLLNWTHAKLE